jgi:hypothetical protein
MHVRAYCSRCRHEHTFVPARHHHLLHLVLTVCTGGIWLVTWVAVCIGQRLRPWRCEHCGWHKPEFRNRPGRGRHAAVPPDREIQPPTELQRSRKVHAFPACQKVA